MKATKCTTVLALVLVKASFWAVVNQTSPLKARLWAEAYKILLQKAWSLLVKDSFWSVIHKSMYTRHIDPESSTSEHIFYSVIEVLSETAANAEWYLKCSTVLVKAIYWTSNNCTAAVYVRCHDKESYCTAAVYSAITENSKNGTGCGVQCHGKEL